MFKIRFVSTRARLAGDSPNLNRREFLGRSLQGAWTLRSALQFDFSKVLQSFLADNPAAASLIRLDEPALNKFAVISRYDMVSPIADQIRMSLLAKYPVRAEDDEWGTKELLMENWSSNQFDVLFGDRWKEVSEEGLKQALRSIGTRDSKWQEFQKSEEGESFYKGYSPAEVESWQQVLYASQIVQRIAVPLRRQAARTLKQKVMEFYQTVRHLSPERAQEINASFYEETGAVPEIDEREMKQAALQSLRRKITDLEKDILDHNGSDWAQLGGKQQYAQLESEQELKFFKSEFQRLSGARLAMRTQGGSYGEKYALLRDALRIIF